MIDSDSRDQTHYVHLFAKIEQGNRSLLAVLRSWRWYLLAFYLGGASSRIIEWVYFR